MNKIHKKISLRFISQLAVVSVVFYLAWIHQRFGIEKAAPIDSYCPFGAVESFFTLVFKGEFLARIFTSSFILMGIFLVSTLFLGRVFCGYFCPLGAIQEWLGVLGGKMGLKNDIKISEKIDKYLRYLKYIILAVIVYFSFYLGELIFRNYDPYSSLMHLGQELKEKWIGYLILGIVSVSALFFKNLWCRYFCPLGAFFGIVKKFSFFKIKRDKITCIDCGICDQKCPASLRIKTVKTVTHADCISCGKCISNCPRNSLSYLIFGKIVSAKKFLALILVLVIMPLIVIPLTPFWKSKPESNIINSRGEVNTADIRGSNTLNYIIKTTKIPFSEFQKKLNLPSDVNRALKLKLIGETYQIKNKEGRSLETEDFRKVVDEYSTTEETESQIESEPKSDPVSEPDCPFGRVECEFPGDCAFYVDSDKNGICDHSE